MTIDALGCQIEIAKTIVDQDSNYVLALKENQDRLYEDVKLLFDDLENSTYKAYAYDYDRKVNKGHGRFEIRACWTISDPDVQLCHLRGFDNWKNLRTVSWIRSQRQVGDEKSVGDRYHIASVCGAKLLLRCYVPFALIGRSRTGYIGFWILLLTKTVFDCVKSMALKTSPFYVILL